MIDSIVYCIFLYLQNLKERD